MKTGTEKAFAETPEAKIADVVASHPFLTGMSPGQIQVLADSAMLKHFDNGELIFDEGDVANRFYLILDGKIALEASRKDAEPQLVQYIGAGDVLGWSWLFAPYYWHFSARAAAATDAIFFYGTRLRDQCEHDKSLGYELMKRMAQTVIQRLQATRKQLVDSQRR